MPWSEAMTPVRMRRVAVIVPQAGLRDTLVRIAEAGCVEVDRVEESAPGAAGRRLQRDPTRSAPSAVSGRPDWTGC
ncbi:hypothetical protein ABZ876_37835 [Streptomyces sp. NPDC046931]|uniref:hypothetical protein n=1 Tax=Streptomyces sp. NPDC046931 TaxID=3154806 RepID=UPI0034030842